MTLRLYIFLFLLVSCGISQGQNREISFESLSFREAVEKADKSKKLLLLDCYTSWCGPCKLMAKEVFTIDSIADFFNRNLVSLKMDMEKGEGPALKEKYQVDAYPTFLLIDGQGNEVYRMVGQQSPRAFMQKIREGMKPENSIARMTARYKSGKWDAAFIYQYCQALKRGFLPDQFNEVVNGYFGKMSVKNICRDENWKIYDEFVSGISNPLYHRLIDGIAQFKALKGESLIAGKLSAEYTEDLFQAILKEPLTPEQYQQYAGDIEKIGLKDEKQLFYLRSYLNLAHLKAQGKYDEILDLIEAGPEGYEPERKTTLVMSLSFLADGTIAQRQRAENLLLVEARKIMAEEGGQLPDNLAQVFGYVQAMLRRGVPTSSNVDSLYTEFKKQYSQETERLNRLYPFNLTQVDSSVLSIRQTHAGLIKFIDYSGLPTDTIAVLQARATMLAYSSLLNMENAMRWIAKVDTILPDSFYSFAGTLNLGMPAWRKIEGMNPFLDLYFAAMEWVGKLKSNRTDYLLHRAEQIKDSVLCENYLIYALQKELDLGYWESLTQSIAMVQPFIVSEGNKKMLGDIVQKQGEMAKQCEHLSRGQKAGELNGKDKNGKKCSLKSFAGKVVVIDVWSTHCLPCIGEMAYLHKLEKQFAGQDVVFVSYSIDRDAENWRKFLKDKNWEGVQLVDTEGAKSPFIKHYAIHSTPRLIIIGRDGKIADAWGSKPSTPFLGQAIEELLKK